MAEDGFTKQRPRALSQLGVNFEQSLEQAAAASEPESPGWRERHRSFMPLAFAAAAAFAVVAILVGLGTRSDSPLSVDDAAASIASIAAAVDLPPADSYTYTETQIRALKKVASGALVPVVQERRAWLSAAKPGRVISSGQDLAAGSQREALRGSIAPANGNVQIAGRAYSGAELVRAAKRPQSLVASIDRAVAGVPAAQRPQLEWQMLSEPLQALAPPLPSAIRAALIARLASVPGVTTLASAKDSLGRKADGFAIENDGVRSRLAFDPKTSVLLESSAVVARDGSGPYGAAKVGALLYRYRLVRTSVVDRLPPK